MNDKGESLELNGPDGDDNYYTVDDIEDSMVFETAQEAFDYIEKILPGPVIVNINPRKLDLH